MELLHHAPRYDVSEAVGLAREVFGVVGSATALPSERDQNFLIETAGGDRYVLKVANATENRALLEAQNAAMAHLATRVDFCPRVMPMQAGAVIRARHGGLTTDDASAATTIAVTPDGEHLVRLVTYLPGTPLALVRDRSADLLESLGRVVGRLDAALADFDHPALRREFHWDLARADAVIAEHLPLVEPVADRGLVDRVSGASLDALTRMSGASLDTRAHASASLDAFARPRNGLRRSIVHHDANDWNVLVENERVVGIIDFGDMVHSWTVADPAVAVAYAMLDADDPLATADAIVNGYCVEHALTHEELAAVFPLASLRLCMSACIAAWQQRQRPDDEYLAISQAPIRRLLPSLAALLNKAG
jgi:Ser/Thr protein kinase RdoA (MazF antagonist)